MKSTVWCLLDKEGQTVGHGKVDTTATGLSGLLRELMLDDELTVGQEVGTLCYFVHDVLTQSGVKLLTFNAYHLRMIASSRKKTDKRDALSRRGSSCEAVLGEQPRDGLRGGGGRNPTQRSATTRTVLEVSAKDMPEQPAPAAAAR